MGCSLEGQRLAGNSLNPSLACPHCDDQIILISSGHTSDVFDAPFLTNSKQKIKQKISTPPIQASAAHYLHLAHAPSKLADTHVRR
jgi:hypothetical protein